MNDQLAALAGRIERYQPINAEEQADQQAMLQFIRRNDDCLDRSNQAGHMTASVWVSDPGGRSVLMEYHNIYQSWSWIGGHADGRADLLQVACCELQEETGLSGFTVAGDDIFSLEVLTVDGHYKNGRYVPSHLHYNLTYRIIADPLQPVRIKPDENKAVQWFDCQTALAKPTEKWMVEHVYRKLIAKMEQTENR